MRRRAALAGGMLLVAVALALLAWLTPAPDSCGATAVGDAIGFFGGLALAAVAVVLVLVAVWLLVRERRIRGAAAWNALTLVALLATLFVAFLAVTESFDFCLEL